MPTIRYTRDFSIGNDGGGLVGSLNQTEEVSEERARQLIYFGLAEYTTEQVAANRRAEHEERPATIPEDDIELPVEEPEEVEMPKPYANKPAWVEYGVAQGGDEEELKGLTKDELISRYGDRL